MKEPNLTKGIAARIDMDVYNFFQKEDIPISSVIRILLKGFVTSDDKLALLTQCLESETIVELNDNEKTLDLFAKERLNTSLWTEEFIKLYKDLKQLP